MLALPKIRENPIVDVYKDDLLKDCFAHGPLYELKRGSIYSRSVRLATISDIHMIGQRIEERPGRLPIFHFRKIEFRVMAGNSVGYFNNQVRSFAISKIFAFRSTSSLHSIVFASDPTPTNRTV